MGTADTVVGLAEAQIGKPYVFGDQGPSTFDCSGLVRYVYGLVGITTPRTAAEQQQWAQPVTNPLPGDLVFYGQPAHHVGIYIGAGRMVDAPHTGANVRIEGVGDVTTYGRVPGAGALAAVPLGVLTGIGDTLSGVLGGVRQIAIEGLALALGAALVGYGLYRFVKPNGDSK